MSILIWLVIGLFVTILLCWAGNKFKHADPSKPPTGVVLVFEQLVHICTGVLNANLTNKTWKYLPFMGTVMIMMVLSNLMGLIGLQSPTSNITLDAVLVMMMIVLIHGTDIKLHGIVGKLKAWCEPLPFLFPLNVIGDLAFPVSLTLRLFGNMLGGTIIVSLLYLLMKSLMPFSLAMYIVTPFLHMYFDIFTAFMQTYIFFTLASYFLGESCDREEE
ncbi:MAG: F0F1 ATP synthase subunit A [Erysipelotrichia bacterium]|nr:F0F1 ATP synthase subunit A [Erysipelotrichia bacterium]